eukprot:scaffold20.g7885.t1
MHRPARQLAGVAARHGRTLAAAAGGRAAAPAGQMLAAAAPGYRAAPGSGAADATGLAPRPAPAEDELPFSEYTPSANAAYWQTRPIGAALGDWYLHGRVGLRGASAQELTDARADKLRHTLTDLGPAFVKIGQDQIPPFDSADAFAVIQAEMGAPAAAIFSSISSEPIAAASLGQARRGGALRTHRLRLQVYKATLHSDGREVAVKVQRPGVATSIALDIFILRQLAAGVRRWRALNTDLPALLDEWAASLFRELDYRTEAANGVRFAELYSHLEDVYVPAMDTRLTTRKVLVMEWVHGERLRTAFTAASAAAAASSSDDLRLVEVGVRCSLEQMLEEGFYHADPHPGNLLRTRDGELAFLDFGMMDDFVTLGMLPQDSEKEQIVPALTGVFAEALKGGVSNLSFGDLSAQLGRTMYQFRFRIPSYYTLLVRSLSVLEGIALASDPNYKARARARTRGAARARRVRAPMESLIRLAGMGVAGKRLEEGSEAERCWDLWGGTAATLLPARAPPEAAPHLRRLPRPSPHPRPAAHSQAVRPTGRPQPRRGSDSAAQRGDALALLLSPQGDFVRGVLIEELAKGIDAAWRLAADSTVGSVRQELLALVAAGGGGGGAAACAAGVPGSGPAAQALLELLGGLPRLATRGDQEQVEGISRLARVLQESTAGTHRGGDWFGEGAGAGAPSSFVSGTPFEAAAEAADTAAAILRWLAAEAATLTPAERAEALRLPISIGQAVGARAAARAIRWALVGDPLVQPAGGRPGSSSSSSYSEEGTSERGGSAGSSSNRAGGGTADGGAAAGGRASSVAGSSSAAGPRRAGGGGRGGGQGALPIMRPLQEAGSGPSSSGGGRNGAPSQRYRAAGLAGASVIVRPTVTAAAPRGA